MKIVRKSENDSICIVTCGVLVHESIKASERLASESIFLFIKDIHVRVIDIFSLKPLDVEGLIANIDATNGRVVIAE